MMMVIVVVASVSQRCMRTLASVGEEAAQGLQQQGVCRLNIRLYIYAHVQNVSDINLYNSSSTHLNSYVSCICLYVCMLVLQYSETKEHAHDKHRDALVTFITHLTYPFLFISYQYLYVFMHIFYTIQHLCISYTHYTPHMCIIYTLYIQLSIPVIVASAPLDGPDMCGVLVKELLRLQNHFNMEVQLFYYIHLY